MAYTTATFTPTSPIMTADGRLYAEVVFTGDSGEKLQQQFYAASGTDLETQVQAYLAKLNTSKADAVKFAPGSVVPAPPAAAITTAPSLTAEQQFFADLNRFLGVQRAVDVGIVPASDPTYLALKDSLTKAFQSAWISDSGWPR